MFTDLVQQSLSGEITPELALEILQASVLPERALKLFEAASRIRDEQLGQELWWSAGISGIFPCRVTPRCGYCTYHTDSFFSTEDIIRGIKEIEGLGLQQLHLSGGTNLQGYDQEILDLVRKIRAVSAIALEVNLGPSLTRETVRQLKGLGVNSITSSLEVSNQELFARRKPGDSLEGRKNLLEFCESEGMPTRGMMLVGLGESDEDRINQLFYLKKFKRLYHLRFSRFYPFPGTECRDLPRCSPWELARTVAVARLILPEVQLGLAAGNESDDIPLWYLAGGGNQLLGVTASRKIPRTQPGQQVKQISEQLFIVDKRPLLEHYVQGMGRKVVLECPNY
ncbi:radical SAM protein [Desulfosporosinus sp. PR]|uniref:radical SAM protein n=1 Tax=Candidatus Desulfosporosinus nitrosoreducens TaxID=3401928 RepID=UPI0027EAFFC2|nr:radical SAM protein [Desulfosporosinus sp. PR]MDQ7095675.1 radical SAM protein [Desulfosporosinus sp. PR]